MNWNFIIVCKIYCLHWRIVKCQHIDSHLEYVRRSVLQLLVLFLLFSLNEETKCKGSYLFFPSTFKVLKVPLQKTSALSLVMRAGRDSWRVAHSWAHSLLQDEVQCVQFIGCSQLSLLWLDISLPCQFLKWPLLLSLV